MTLNTRITDSKAIQEVFCDSEPTIFLKENDVLPPRKPTDHKGMFGHVLLIGGDVGMGGAICLAAEAALRVGAGLVTAVTRPEHVSALLTRCPEIMSIGISDGPDLTTLLLPLLKKATVCVIGPGLGESDWSQSLLRWVLVQQMTLNSLKFVLDAGALTWLAKKRDITSPNWVLTPHPGEAAALLGSSTSEIQQNRLASIKALQKKWDGTIVLKGAGTLIYEGNSAAIKVCEYQNGAMATAGMGDVLSGIIGGLIAQGCSLVDAASQGVWFHAHAADLAFKAKSEKLGCRSLLAHELFDYFDFAKR